MQANTLWCTYIDIITNLFNCHANQDARVEQLILEREKAREEAAKEKAR